MRHPLVNYMATHTVNDRSSLSTCAPDGHLLRVKISDAASVKFNLPMMSI